MEGAKSRLYSTQTSELRVPQKPFPKMSVPTQYGQVSKAVYWIKKCLDQNIHVRYFAFWCKKKMELVLPFPGCLTDVIAANYNLEKVKIRDYLRRKRPDH